MLNPGSDGRDGPGDLPEAPGSLFKHPGQLCPGKVPDVIKPAAGAAGNSRADLAKVDFTRGPAVKAGQVRG